MNLASYHLLYSARCGWAAPRPALSIVHNGFGSWLYLESFLIMKVQSFYLSIFELSEPIKFNDIDKSLDALTGFEPVE